MEKVKEGDLGKLGLLFERYKGMLFGYFYNLSKDAAYAEDMVQSVFLRIIKYKHSFKGTGEFKIWMMHIARNVNIDHFRKNSKLQTTDIDEQMHTPQLETANWEEKRLKEDDFELLRMAMHRLDKEKREILTLSKLEEIKYSEIGTLLNCSEGAVKVKVFRALQALKQEYKRIQTLV